MTIVISWLLAAAAIALVNSLARFTASDLTGLLTMTGAVIIAALCLWFALSVTAYRYAQRRRDRRLLRALRLFGAPVIRRLAAVSLTAPLALSITPAYSHVPDSERPVIVVDDPNIDLSWGAPLPSVTVEPEYADLLARSTHKVLPTPDLDLDHTALADALRQDQSRPEQTNVVRHEPLGNPESLHETLTHQDSPTTVVVRPGDNLWKIAQQVRPSDDPAQLSELVALIWKHNRHVIGDNPHLILPGQELLIPHN